jgi:RNA polymerase sigma-70 factor (ECF subfamily)
VTECELARLLSGVRESSQSDQFAALALPLLKPLYNFAHWLTRDAAEAEDLVQDAYVRALKGFGGFQPGTNFKAWMFRIVRNTFLSSRAGVKAVHVPLEDEEGEEIELPAVTDTPESALVGVRTREQIQAALERLPQNFREVILLCDVEEMRYQEIAELLEIPLGTVMSRIARGRKLLRGMLAEAQIRR